MENRMKKLYIIFAVILISVAIIIGVSVYYGTKASNEGSKAPAVKPKPTKKPMTTAKSGTTPTNTPMPTPSRGPNAAQVFKKAAVAADSEICSKIGRDILKQQGSAVDSIIATLICTGAVNLHSTGIGGGGFMVVYNRKTKKAEAFDYRETGPAAMNETIFNYVKNDEYKVGGLAVGVPGEIRGLRAAFNKYGQLPWRKLFEPTIKLCKDGFPLGKALHDQMKKTSNKNYILADPGLKELLAPTGTILDVGTTLKNPKLATTLERLSMMPDDLFTGDLAKTFIADVKKAGGIMTEGDLKNYKVHEKVPLTNKLGNYTHFTLPLPNGGPVLTSMLNINEGFNFSSTDRSTLNKTILTFHRIAESFFFSYGFRPYLGDPDFQKNNTDFMKHYNETMSKVQAQINRLKIDDTRTQNVSVYSDWYKDVADQGTTHVSVLAENGDAASATDTINYGFGAKFRSLTSGIIYNNELADFFRATNGSAYPWPRANAPGPGKRPLSSTCPSIIVDENGDVKMVVGASGGLRITLSVAWVIMNKLWFDMELGESVVDPRAYAYLFPKGIRDDRNHPVNATILDGLKKLGHKISKISSFAVVQTIYKSKDGLVHAKSDPRKYGKAAGY